jgi:hypothetical protein
MMSVSLSIYGSLITPFGMFFEGHAQRTFLKERILLFYKLVFIFFLFFGGVENLQSMTIIMTVIAE